MTDLINKWKDKIVQYLDVHIKLIKLNFIERTSNVLSYIIFVMLALFLVFAVLMFLGLGMAEAYSNWFDSRTWGYLATAGTFLLIVIIVMAAHEQISKLFSVIFIRILTNKGDDDDDDDDDDDKASKN